MGNISLTTNKQAEYIEVEVEGRIGPRQAMSLANDLGKAAMSILRYKNRQMEDKLRHNSSNSGGNDGE